MKGFLDKFGQWPRHKVRVIIIKQWKKLKHICINQQRLNRLFQCRMTEEEIFKAANCGLGWYRRCGLNVVNFLLSSKVLAIKKKDRPRLVDSLNYCLSSSC